MGTGRSFASLIPTFRRIKSRSIAMGGSTTSLGWRRSVRDASRGPTCQEVAMEVDVETEVEIGRPRAEVAAYAMDPDNAMIWYRNITKVDWKTPPPLQVGSRIAFVAKFLGRTIAYTYEVEELVPNELFVMATTEGPFAMATTYSWSDVGDGGTRMTLRNSGRPSEQEGPGPPKGNSHPGPPSAWLIS